MNLPYEIEIRCPKIFHDFSKEQPTKNEKYLLYFADTREFTIAEYFKDRRIFKYEDYEEFYDVRVTDSDTFWAEIFDISNFIETYLI